MIEQTGEIENIYMLELYIICREGESTRNNMSKNPTELDLKYHTHFTDVDDTYLESVTVKKWFTEKKNALPVSLFVHVFDIPFCLDVPSVSSRRKIQLV